MRIQLLSDLHTENHEFPLDFLSNGKIQYAPDVDVLVLAGDIVDVCRQPVDEVLGVFEYLGRRARHLVYVAGNHEYWGWEGAGHDGRHRKGTLERTENVLLAVAKKVPNFHWLNNSEVTLDGQHFVGGTMWFPYRPGIEDPARMWSDFDFIFKLYDWVYDSNNNFRDFALKHVRKDSVVVTHHLPNRRSCNPQFQDAGSNIFFVSDMTEVIFRREPKLWMHGHTHNSADYMYDETRVLCNPYGYDQPKKGYPTNKHFGLVVVEV